MEKRCLMVEAYGKRIVIPGANKITISINSPETKHIQASMDVTVENIEKMHRHIRKPQA